MVFTIHIQDPNRAVEFAKFLSSFTAVDALSVEAETAADNSCLNEIKDLLKHLLITDISQSETGEAYESMRAELVQILANMTDAEKEEARKEHERVKRAMLFKGLSSS